MKFKENAIKPGMVIHCPKEEDAKELLEHLDSLGFGRHGNLVNWVNENTCYVINTENKWVTRSDVRLYHRKEITEFSDLIEPEPDLELEVKDGKSTLMMHGVITSEVLEDNLDNNLDNQQDNEMSAVEVLEWLMKYHGKMEFKECFGQLYAMDILFRLFTAEEIFNKITAYKAAKKVSKPVDVEEGYFCELYEKKDNYDVVLLDYNMWGVDKNVAIKDAKEKARERVSKTKNPCYVRVIYKCRVKEDK